MIYSGCKIIFLEIETSFFYLVQRVQRTQILSGAQFKARVAKFGMVGVAKCQGKRGVTKLRTPSFPIIYTRRSNCEHTLWSSEMDRNA